MARKYHPDAPGGNAERMSHINAIWDRLEAAWPGDGKPIVQKKIENPKVARKDWSIHFSTQAYFEAVAQVIDLLLFDHIRQHAIDLSKAGRRRARLGLSLRAEHEKMKKPRLVFHSPLRADRQKGGMVSLHLTTRPQEGQNILVFPAIHPDNPRVVQSALRTVTLPNHLLEDFAKGKMLVVHNPAPFGPFQVRTRATTNANVFDLSNPDPQFFFSTTRTGRCAQAEALRLRKMLDGTAHPFLRPFLHLARPFV